MSHRDDDRPIGGSKVFIGGLPAEVTTDDLQDYFSVFGTVVDAFVMKLRGFGFIEYEEESAGPAAVESGPHTLAGKEVSVKIAESREAMAHGKSDHAGPANTGPPDMPNKLFVGGLPRSCETLALKEYFEKYGRLTDVVVMPSRGFGFVSFEDRDAFEEAMEHNGTHVIEGFAVSVKPADGHRPKPSGSFGNSGRVAGNGGYGPVGGGSSRYSSSQHSDERSRPYERGPPSSSRGGAAHGGSRTSTSGGIRKVFVGGLPKDMTTRELEDYFDRFGRIVDCVAMNGRGFGFVEFDDSRCVDALMRKSGNIIIRGCQVSLRLADGKKGGPPGTGGGFGGGDGGGRGGRGGPIGGGPGPVVSYRSDQGHGKGGAWGPDGNNFGASSGKLFIRGLPDDMSDRELSDFFDSYGPISDAKVMTGRGFGFVTFVRNDSSRRCLQDEHQIDGFALTIKKADGMKGSGR